MTTATTTIPTYRTQDGRQIATMRIDEIQALIGCSREVAVGLWEAAQAAMVARRDAELAAGLARIGATVTELPSWWTLMPRGR